MNTNQKKQDQQGKVPDPTTPAIQDENSPFGSTSDSAEEKDVLDEAHDVGLYSDAEEDEPEELDIAGEVEEAEKQQ